VRSLLPALLLACAAAHGAAGEVEKQQDDFGRMVYRSPSPAPHATDQDLLPPTEEELAEELRNLPRVRTVSADVPFAEMIREASLRYGVDADLIEAVMATESAFNPFAVSRAGAVGLMQLMPATAKRYGVTDIFNPRENVLGGVRYLSYLLKLFDGDLSLSLAAYNAGENAVLRHGGIPPYKETRTYVRKVRRYLGHVRSTAPAPATATARTAEPAPSPDWLLRPSPPAATIYHYVDHRGVVHFTNVQPSEGVGKVNVWKPGG